jgi:TP901 family phage tail tape measure protein
MIYDESNRLNSFAETNEDIVEGMERSAAALSAVGTTYQDAFALFTGAQEILQDSSVAGRALRSISLRVRGYSEDSEDSLLETDDELTTITGDLIDLTKTAEHTQGVSIFKEGSTTEFKRLVDYFGEINAIWDEMDEKQQNDYLQKAFGKTQAQAGAALITNYQAIKDSLEAMENSAGSSDAEMQKIEQSLTYRLNRLTETWTGTWQNLLDRGDIGKVIDLLTSLSEAIGWVIDKAGVLGTLGLGAAVTASFKNVGKPKSGLHNCFEFTDSNKCSYGYISFLIA